MRSTRIWTVLAILAFLAALAPTTLAQKGKGDETGVARSAVRLETTNVSGKLLRIKDGPCSKTTGRSPTGIHLFLENEEGDEINLHLGPSAAVSHMTEGLEKGDRVTARAFRTDRFAADEYVAVRFSTDDEEFTLRDETLRPVWAGRPLAPAGDRQDDDRIRREGRRMWQSTERNRDVRYFSRPGRGIGQRERAYRQQRRGTGWCARARRGRRGWSSGGRRLRARHGRGFSARSRGWVSGNGYGPGCGQCWRMYYGERQPRTDRRPRRR